MKKQMVVGIASALLGAFFIGAALFYDTGKAGKANRAAKDNSSVLIRDYSPVKGSADAKVTIIEFFDPACETCSAFYPFTEELMEAHDGKIRLVLRYTPFHAGSDYVVKVLEAARQQDLFWEVLEATFESQPAWASHANPQPENIWMYLENTGLDFEKARNDMHSSTITDRIRQDMSDARQLQVSKTPSYFVNGKPLISFGYRQLQELVESEVRAQYQNIAE